jgi:hypothetical protein
MAFLSYVFLLSWQEFPWPNWQVRFAGRLGVSPWQAFLGETLLLSTLYFWLMAKFDEGVIFWTLLLILSFLETCTQHASSFQYSR